MAVVAALLFVIAAFLATRVVMPAIRRHRTPDELRGDWWPAFEREFRAYARRTARPRRGDR